MELLGNEQTDPTAVDWAADFYARCNKTTIRLHKEVPGHVANRLQAALWREAIHLVADGVASVEDVDKAVVHGPGLRWSIMGPHMLFNLGSGGHGMEVFCERYPRLLPPLVGQPRRPHAYRRGGGRAGKRSPGRGSGPQIRTPGWRNGTES